jgi:hypothetical protein
MGRTEVTRLYGPASIFHGATLTSRPAAGDISETPIQAPGSPNKEKNDKSQVNNRAKLLDYKTSYKN